eukprot:3653536-Ditylum_brightwellii.AAC.1
MLNWWYKQQPCTAFDSQPIMKNWDALSKETQPISSKFGPPIAIVNCTAFHSYQSCLTHVIFP